jgi:hypothetical protein
MRTAIQRMLRCEASTTLAPAVALAVAEQFFNSNIGLAVEKREPQALRFMGDDDYVSVRIIRARPTTLEVVTSVWETPVLEFVDRLPR